MKRPALLLLLAACGRDHDVAPRHEIDDRPETAPLTFTTAIDVSEGLLGPEAILYDDQAGVYLVSNMNGGPHEADDNGFISRISPDGQVIVERWIDAVRPDITLHAPRGMALAADTLYVVDIDGVRLFDRTTGAPKGNWPLPDPHFPNDIRVDADGNVLVTETAIHLQPNGDPVHEGTDTIWKIDPQGHVTPFAQGDELHGPNGIALTRAGVVVATFTGNELYRLTDGKKQTIVLLPATQLDGLVELPDQSLIVTSWKPRALWRVWPDGSYRQEFTNASFVGAASIDYDAKRGRLLVPLVLANQIRFEPYVVPEP